MWNPSTKLRTGIAAVGLGIAMLAATAVWASETITYSYDARGRLKIVAHTGTVNNGKTTTYSLDKADNRTVKNTM
jgi:hypothetical protein